MSSFVNRAALRDCWYPVAEAADLLRAAAEERPLGVRLLGENFVVWPDGNGAVLAAPDRCPHREAPLSIGSVTDNGLTCIYHGWTFGDEGHCTGIPSSGRDASIPPTAHLACVNVQERYGLIWLCPGEPGRAVPTIDQDTDPAFRRINTGIEPWAVSAVRMVDNFMDVSHFPYVHSGTFGGGQDPVVAKVELTQLDDEFYGYAYEVDASNPEEAQAISGSTDDVVHRHMSTGFALPFLVRSTIRYEDGLEHILLLSSTPVDDTNSLFTFVVWRNDDHSADPEETIAFDRAIGAEDKVMLEQIPGTLPLDRVGLANVQSDKPSVEWRRRFAELIGHASESATATSTSQTGTTS